MEHHATHRGGEGLCGKNLFKVVLYVCVLIAAILGAIISHAELVLMRDRKTSNDTPNRPLGYRAANTESILDSKFTVAAKTFPFRSAFLPGKSISQEAPGYSAPHP